AGKAEDLATPQREGGLLDDGRRHQVAHVEHDVAGWALVTLRKQLVDRSTNNVRYQRLVARPAERAIGHAASVAEHGEDIGDGTHLFKEVADVDEPDAFTAEPPDEREQVLDVVALQAAGRLVHQHDPRVRGD